MRLNYERWILSRLTERPRCSLESSMRCIPLRGDPICMACFESDAIEELSEKDDNS
jgi:hypothetical protein